MTHRKNAAGNRVQVAEKSCMKDRPPKMEDRVFSGHQVNGSPSASLRIAQLEVSVRRLFPQSPEMDSGRRNTRLQTVGFRGSRVLGRMGLSSWVMASPIVDSGPAIGDPAPRRQKTWRIGPPATLGSSGFRVFPERRIPPDSQLSLPSQLSISPSYSLSVSTLCLSGRKEGRRRNEEERRKGEEEHEVGVQ